MWMAKVPVRSGRWVLVLWSPFMGLVPMGLLLHSHRSLHEIRMALHEIHEIRSRMERITRLQNGSAQAALISHRSTHPSSFISGPITSLKVMLLRNEF